MYFDIATEPALGWGRAGRCANIDCGAGPCATALTLQPRAPQHRPLSTRAKGYAAFHLRTS